jgi:hypothetical protein
MLSGIFLREGLDRLLVICPTSGFCRTHGLHIVIASEAKQSIARLAETWIASSLALRAKTRRCVTQAVAAVAVADKQYRSRNA